MNTKVDEGKLISGKEALIALANGEEVEVSHPHDKWYEGWESLNSSGGKFFLLYLLDETTGYKFRLKPHTISINGIEVPAPADDKDYHHQGIWILNSLELKEYGYVVLDITDELPRYWWKSEEEIKQVVAALRQVFGGSHDN